MVIDIHAHPTCFEAIFRAEESVRWNLEMGLLITKEAPMELLFAQMDHAGVDRLCLMPLDLTTERGIRIVENEDIAELVRRWPERFIGFAGVDPWREDAVETLEHAFRDLGLRGLKLHPSRQKFYPSDERLEPLYEICLQYDRPIMFHAGTSWEPDTPAEYSMPLCFEKLAIRHPELRFCLAHFGWPWVRETAMLLMKYPNVYADTSLCYCDRPADFLRQTFTVDLSMLWMENGYADKVMFATNLPRFGMKDMAEGIRSLGLRNKTEKKIFAGNALTFLGLTEEELKGLDPERKDPEGQVR